MIEVSFLRLRPAEEISELWAATRRREGTTVAEVSELSVAGRAAALGGGLAPVATTAVNPAEPMAWVVGPHAALDLSVRGVPGWRLTVVDTGEAELVLDALARSKAAFSLV